MNLSGVAVDVTQEYPHLLCNVTVENAGVIVEGLLYHAKNPRMFQEHCEALVRTAKYLHRKQEDDKSHALAQEIDRVIKGLRGQRAFIDAAFKDTSSNMDDVFATAASGIMAAIKGSMHKNKACAIPYELERQLTNKASASMQQIFVSVFACTGYETKNYLDVIDRINLDATVKGLLDATELRESEPPSTRKCAKVQKESNGKVIESAPSKDVKDNMS